MIRFELVTLNGVRYSESVYEVQLPTPDGYIGVLQNHAPLISLASPGVISVRPKENTPDDMMDSFATNGGVIEIQNNTVRMLVDEADTPDEINEAEIKRALDEALSMRAKAKDQISLDQAQQLIDRSNVRLKVAELKKSSKNRR